MSPEVLTQAVAGVYHGLADCDSRSGPAGGARQK